MLLVSSQSKFTTLTSHEPANGGLFIKWCQDESPHPTADTCRNPFHSQAFHTANIHFTRTNNFKRNDRTAPQLRAQERVHGTLSGSTLDSFTVVTLPRSVLPWSDLNRVTVASPSLPGTLIFPIRPHHPETWQCRIGSIRYARLYSLCPSAPGPTPHPRQAQTQSSQHFASRPRCPPQLCAKEDRSSSRRPIHLRPTLSTG